MLDTNFIDKNYDIFTLFDKQWALVTAGNIDNFNGCTIGWGSLGNIWGGKSCSKKIATIYVHPQRYTTKFLLDEDYFTISFFSEIYRNDLLILGSKSGRDYLKFSETNLTPAPYNNCVVFKEARLTFVCKKIYWERFNPTHLITEIAVDYYQKHQLEPHYQFIGEIIEII